MAIQSLDTDLMNDRPDLALLYEKMRASGEHADAIADLPTGFFDGVNVRALNCNGLACDGKSVSSFVERCRMSEMLGHADPALAVALPGPGLTLSILQNFASPRQYGVALKILQSDEPRWGAFALSEPRSGSDATHLTTSASPTSDGYILNGEKCYIGNAGRAQFVVVFATIEERKGQFGIRAFFVELPRVGVSIEDTNRMLGLRAVRISRLRFNNCLVQADAMLGHDTGHDLARTFAFAQQSFDSMRPCLSSLIVGAGFGIIDRLQAMKNASSTLRGAIEILIERFAGPLTSARLLCRNTATLLDGNTPSSTASSICKLFATEQVCALADHALMLPGVAGCKGFNTLSRLHRDCQAFRMMEGTSDVQRLMIARSRMAWHSRRENAERVAQRKVA